MNSKSYSKNELEKLTKVQLLEIGKGMNLKGLSILKKADIIDKLLDNSNTTPINAEKKSTDTPKIIEKSRKKSQAPSSEIAYTSPKSMKTPDHEMFPIPFIYNDTSITALIKDPEWLYTYWSIKEENIQFFNLRKRRILLRIYDITDINFNGENAHYQYDIDVTLNIYNWYIKVPEANRSYCIDLGYIDEMGQFVTLARSNIVLVPRNGVSDKYDEQWMTVEELIKLSGAYKGRLQTSGSFEIEQMLAERMKMVISSEAFLSSWSLPSSLDFPSSMDNK